MKVRNEALLDITAPIENQVFRVDNDHATCNRQVSEYECFLQSHKNDITYDECLHMANLYEREHMYYEAGRIYDIAISQFPFYEKAHFRLGKVLLKQERVNEAAAVFSFTERLSPNDISTRFYAGISYMLLGLYEKSNESFHFAKEKAETKEQMNIVSEWNWLSLMLGGNVQKAAESIDYVSLDDRTINGNNSIKLCLLYKGILTVNTVRDQLQSEIATSDRDCSSGLFGVAQYMIFNNLVEEGNQLMLQCIELQNSSLCSIAARQMTKVVRRNILL